MRPQHTCCSEWSNHNPAKCLTKRWLPRPRNYFSRWTVARPQMASHSRGEVWLVDLGFAAKTRPCVVLSDPAVNTNDRALTTLVPHTTSPRGSAFEADFAVRF